MGTWDSGPFDNDAAADFLSESGGAKHSLAELLRGCADAPPDAYLDADDGQPVIAACELIALGFGYGKLDGAPKNVRAIARTIGPDESLRLLAIRALPRIRDREHSEVASLWAHDPTFNARLDDLLSRLVDAGN
jgi:hypothetical protein